MAITIQEAQVLFSADGMKQVQTEAGKAASAIGGIASKARLAGAALSGVRGAFSGFGEMLAVLGVAAAGAKVMNLAMEAEATAISFDVLLGSATKARKALEDLRQLDKETVFGLPQLSQAQKLMLNYGLNAEESFSILTQLTKVAQGNAEQLMLLSKGMAQVKAAGRLMGQEANQLINSGFSPLFEISQQTGRGMRELKQDMEAGLISYDMVRQALAGLTTGTGRLADINERLSKSTGGMFAKFQTNVEVLATQIGTALLPELNKILAAANGTADSIGEIKTESASMVSVVRDFWNETQGTLADFGTAIAITFQQLPNQLSLIFEDIKTWLSELVDYTIAAGKSMASNLSPSVLMGDAKAIPMPSLEFSPRQSGGVGAGMIMPEIELNRRTRAEARQREGAAELGRQMREAMRPDRVQAPPTELMDIAAGAATEAAVMATQEIQSQRGGAADMFRSLQDRLAKQFEADKIAKQQLDIQKQQLDVNKQILGAFSGGLAGVAILG